MPRARSVCSHNAPVPCGQPAVRDGRCAVHARERDAQRGRRQERGYGAAHDRARETMIIQWAAASRRGERWRCPRCLEVLVLGQPVDADHFRTRPPALPDRLSHAACNRGKRLPDPQGA